MTWRRMTASICGSRPTASSPPILRAALAGFGVAYLPEDMAQDISPQDA